MAWLGEEAVTPKAERRGLVGLVPVEMDNGSGLRTGPLATETVLSLVESPAMLLLARACFAGASRGDDGGWLGWRSVVIASRAVGVAVAFAVEFEIDVGITRPSLVGFEDGLSVSGDGNSIKDEKGRIGRSI